MQLAFYGTSNEATKALKIENPVDYIKMHMPSPKRGSKKKMNNNNNDTKNDNKSSKKKNNNNHNNSLKKTNNLKFIPVEQMSFNTAAMAATLFLNLPGKFKKKNINNNNNNNNSKTSNNDINTTTESEYQKRLRRKRKKNASSSDGSGNDMIIQPPNHPPLASLRYLINKNTNSNNTKVNNNSGVGSIASGNTTTTTTATTTVGSTTRSLSSSPKSKNKKNKKNKKNFSLAVTEELKWNSIQQQKDNKNLNVDRNDVNSATSSIYNSDDTTTTTTNTNNNKTKSSSMMMVSRSNSSDSTKGAAAVFLSSTHEEVMKTKLEKDVHHLEDNLSRSAQFIQDITMPQQLYLKKAKRHLPVAYIFGRAAICYVRIRLQQYIAHWKVFTEWHRSEEAMALLMLQAAIRLQGLIRSCRARRRMERKRYLRNKLHMAGIIMTGLSRVMKIAKRIVFERNEEKRKIREEAEYQIKLNVSARQVQRIWRGILYGRSVLKMLGVRMLLTMLKEISNGHIARIPHMSLPRMASEGMKDALDRALHPGFPRRTLPSMHAIRESVEFLNWFTNNRETAKQRKQREWMEKQIQQYSSKTDAATKKYVKSIKKRLKIAEFYALSKEEQIEETKKRVERARVKKEMESASKEMKLMWEEEKVTRDFEISEKIFALRKLELEMQYMYAEDLKSKSYERDIETFEIEEDEKERMLMLSTFNVADHPMVGTDILEFDPKAKRISEYTQIEMDKFAVVATPIPSPTAKKAWELIQLNNEVQKEMNKFTLNTSKQVKIVKDVKAEIENDKIEVERMKLVYHSEEHPPTKRKLKIHLAKFIGILKGHEVDLTIASNMYDELIEYSKHLVNMLIENLHNMTGSVAPNSLMEFKKATNTLELEAGMTKVNRWISNEREIFIKKHTEAYIEALQRIDFLKGLDVDPRDIKWFRLALNATFMDVYSVFSSTYEVLLTIYDRASNYVRTKIPLCEDYLCTITRGKNYSFYIFDSSGGDTSKGKLPLKNEELELEFILKKAMSLLTIERRDTSGRGLVTLKPPKRIKMADDYLDLLNGKRSMRTGPVFKWILHLNEGTQNELSHYLFIGIRRVQENQTFMTCFNTKTFTTSIFIIPGHLAKHAALGFTLWKPLCRSCGKDVAKIKTNRGRKLCYKCEKEMVRKDDSKNSCKSDEVEKRIEILAKFPDMRKIFLTLIDKSDNLLDGHDSARYKAAGRIFQSDFVQKALEEIASPEYEAQHYKYPMDKTDYKTEYAINEKIQRLSMAWGMASEDVVNYFTKFFKADQYIVDEYKSIEPTMTKQEKADTVLDFRANRPMSPLYYRVGYIYKPKNIRHISKQYDIQLELKDIGQSARKKAKAMKQLKKKVLRMRTLKELRERKSLWDKVREELKSIHDSSKMWIDRTIDQSNLEKILENKVLAYEYLVIRATKAKVFYQIQSRKEDAKREYERQVELEDRRLWALATGGAIDEFPYLFPMVEEQDHEELIPVEEKVKGVDKQHLASQEIAHIWLKRQADHTFCHVYLKQQSIRYDAYIYLIRTIPKLQKHQENKTIAFSYLLKKADMAIRTAIGREYMDEWDIKHLLKVVQTRKAKQNEATNYLFNKGKMAIASKELSMLGYVGKHITDFEEKYFRGIKQERRIKEIDYLQLREEREAIKRGNEDLILSYKPTRYDKLNDEGSMKSFGVKRERAHLYLRQQFYRAEAYRYLTNQFTRIKSFERLTKLIHSCRRQSLIRDDTFIWLKARGLRALQTTSCKVWSTPLLIAKIITQAEKHIPTEKEKAIKYLFNKGNQAKAFDYLQLIVIVAFDWKKAPFAILEFYKWTPEYDKDSFADHAIKEQYLKELGEATDYDIGYHEDIIDNIDDINTGTIDPKADRPLNRKKLEAFTYLKKLTENQKAKIFLQQSVSRKYAYDWLVNHVEGVKKQMDADQRARDLALLRAQGDKAGLSRLESYMKLIKGNRRNPMYIVKVYQKNRKNNNKKKAERKAQHILRNQEPTFEELVKIGEIAKDWRKASYDLSDSLGWTTPRPIDLPKVEAMTEKLDVADIEEEELEKMLELDITEERDLLKKRHWKAIQYLTHLVDEDSALRYLASKKQTYLAFKYLSEQGTYAKEKLQIYIDAGIKNVEEAMQNTVVVEKKEDKRRKRKERAKGGMKFSPKQVKKKIEEE